MSKYCRRNIEGYSKWELEKIIEFQIKTTGLPNCPDYRSMCDNFDDISMLFCNSEVLLGVCLWWLWQCPNSSKRSEIPHWNSNICCYQLVQFILKHRHSRNFNRFLNQFFGQVELILCSIQVPKIHQSGIIAWIQFDCVFVVVHGRCIITVLRCQSTNVVVDFRIIWTNAKCRSVQLFLVGPVTCTLIRFQHENQTNEHSECSGNLWSLIFMNSPTMNNIWSLPYLWVFLMNSFESDANE